MTISNNKVKFVFFDKNTVSTIPTLATFVRVLEPSDSDLRSFAWYLYNLHWVGLYCGSLDDLNKVVAGRKYTSTTAPSKVCFSKTATYPRYKLREYASIKIKRDATKADAFIVGKFDLPEQYQNVGPNQSGYSVRKLTKQKVMYSPSEDMYYVIWDNDYPGFSNNTASKVWNKYLAITPYSASNFMKNYASELANSGVIPTDCTQVYEGTLTLLSEDRTEMITTLENNPTMQVIYDTDLDKFIVSQLKKMEAEDVQTLVSMLQSTDQSIVAMGIKLLATYNITDSMCTCGTLLATCWKNLRYNDAAKSVGFKSVLSTLGLERDDFSYYGDNSSLINKLYAASQNEDDRNTCRTAILKSVESEVLKRFEELKTIYSNFDFNINVTIS